MALKITLEPRTAHSRLSALLGGLLCTALAGAAAFAALSPTPPAGGIPLLPPAWNAAIGRGLFGFGALLCAGMALWAFHDAWRGPPAGPAERGPDSTSG